MHVSHTFEESEREIETHADILTTDFKHGRSL